MLLPGHRLLFWCRPHSYATRATVEVTRVALLMAIFSS